MQHWCRTITASGSFELDGKALKFCFVVLNVSPHSCIATSLLVCCKRLPLLCSHPISRGQFAGRPLPQQ